MTRFVIDTTVALHLARTGAVVPARHKLLAPTLFRSQILSLLHESVHSGELSATDARAQLALIGKMPIRLLGDAVLRRRAWDLATELGWSSTYDAEYIALTQLQGDAFVTLDTALAKAVQKVVPVETIAALGVRGKR